MLFLWLLELNIFFFGKNYIFFYKKGNFKKVFNLLLEKLSFYKNMYLSFGFYFL